VLFGGDLNTEATSLLQKKPEKNALENLKKKTDHVEKPRLQTLESKSVLIGRYSDIKIISPRFTDSWTRVYCHFGVRRYEKSTYFLRPIRKKSVWQLDTIVFTFFKFGRMLSKAHMIMVHAVSNSKTKRLSKTLGITTY